MAILQPADLLVVYKPEYGFVSTLSKENINASDLLNDSGEAYSISTTPKGSLINDSGEEEDYTSPAQGLTLNLKIRSGTIVDMSVVSGGFDYVVGELVDVDGGDQCVLISSVNEIGGVVEASLYSGEGGYSITSGLLTDFPYGYHDTIMNTVHPLEGGPNSGNFVDIRVEDNVVTGAYIGSKVFESDTEFEGQKFTVGEEVHILADKTNAGLHIQSSVLSVLEPESGGPAKFSVSNLESDVKSWASEVMPTIDVVIQENDGSFDHGGGLGYNVNNGELTYVRSYNPAPTEGSINLDESYGNVVDANGLFTSVEINSQQQLNAQLMRRIQFLEELIYDSDTTNNLLKDEVVLKDGAKSYNGYENPETGLRDTSRIATANDLYLVEGTANAAAINGQIAVDILNALSEATNFDELKAALITDD